ncbi:MULTISPECIES: TadE/TadG family type IV pilus assembly protein [unclassified Micromonospora]|uniref:TadE/TadG family type IV pilus assembly protein n=1 Tax=unclassified Micromonospora TaxID=2617518 RepID=UPI000EF4E04C|nr:MULTISPECIES: TadE/TadG family type IV pilus assembly protein [unclassified Micromonospora]RLP91556.1 pilus assembly protein [Micromonospora sp. BL4]RLP96601.1 pilus assembly protein [Micromonospora sp. CV4]
MNRSAERGSVSIEVAVLAPAFIALMVLAGVAGRSAVAAEAIDAAAHDAARAASISRDARSARTAAREAARKQLDWHGLACANDLHPTFSGSVAGKATSFNAAFRSPVGTDATVTVEISCLVSFKDISLNVVPGMPTDNRITASFTSPLDRYRSRR